MDFTKRLKALNLIVGGLLVLLLNVVGALPRIYKGVQHPVGPDVVAVFPARADSQDLRTPVMTIAQNGFSDTGQRVQVYLRNTYKDDMITFYPRLTLLVAACTAVLHFLLASLAR